MDKAEWEGEFFEEYKRRVGISYRDAGGDVAEAFDRYNVNMSPSEAVTHEIEQYDLEDLDKQDPWVSGRKRPAPKMRRRRR